MNPMVTALIIAHGTAFDGFEHSSAMCMEASKPLYMKHEVERPVMKQTPSGHPVTLMNVPQTKPEEAFGVPRTSRVMNPVAKRHIVKATIDRLAHKRVRKGRCPTHIQYNESMMST